MKIELPAGKYVVAVSGGVDSVVLLDMLRLLPGVKLTVAHFDHGIREDSAADRLFVKRLAKRYGLPFVSNQGKLGPGASEAEARKARYSFLKKAQKAADARAIVTAHHQDDLVETMIINLLRGTGRKGLSSLTSSEEVARPLLEVPKAEIISYAKRHRLEWREDSTNESDDYLRNRVRHHILPSWSAAQKAQLVRINRRMRELNQEVDDLLEPVVQGNLSRQWFNQLPYDVACEVLAAWLRANQILNFDSATLERLAVAAKVTAPKKFIDIVNGYRLHVQPDVLALTGPER